MQNTTVKTGRGWNWLWTGENSYGGEESDPLLHYFSYLSCSAIPNFLSSHECDVAAELSKKVGLHPSLTAGLLELTTMKEEMKEDADDATSGNDAKKGSFDSHFDEFFPNLDADSDGFLTISEVRCSALKSGNEFFKITNKKLNQVCSNEFVAALPRWT